MKLPPPKLMKIMPYYCLMFENDVFSLELDSLPVQHVMRILDIMT